LNYTHANDGFKYYSAGKPLSLFAKTVTKSADTAKEESGGFQDIKSNTQSK